MTGALALAVFCGACRRRASSTSAAAVEPRLSAEARKIPRRGTIDLGIHTYLLGQYRQRNPNARLTERQN